MSDSTNHTNICAICLMPLATTRSLVASEESDQNDTTIGACVPCGHCFHMECFDGWKSSQQRQQQNRSRQSIKCPTCNTKSNDFCRLFLDLFEVANDDDDSDDEDDSDDDETTNDNYNTMDESFGLDILFKEVDEAQAEQNNDISNTENDDIIDLSGEEIIETSNDISTMTSRQEKQKCKSDGTDSTPERSQKRKLILYKRKYKRLKQHVTKIESQSKQYIAENKKLMTAREKHRNDLQEMANQLQNEHSVRKELQRENEVIHLKNIRLQKQRQDAMEMAKTEERKCLDLQNRMQQLEECYARDVHRAHANSMKEVKDILEQYPKLTNENQSLKEKIHRRNDEIKQLRTRLGMITSNKQPAARRDESEMTTSIATTYNNSRTSSNKRKAISDITNILTNYSQHEQEVTMSKNKSDRMAPSSSRGEGVSQVYSSHAARISRASDRCRIAAQPPILRHIQEQEEIYGRSEYHDVNSDSKPSCSLIGMAPRKKTFNSDLKPPILRLIQQQEEEMYGRREYTEVNSDSKPSCSLIGMAPRKKTYSRFVNNR